MTTEESLYFTFLPFGPFIVILTIYILFAKRSQRAEYNLYLSKTYNPLSLKTWATINRFKLNLALTFKGDPFMGNHYNLDKLIAETPEDALWAKLTDKLSLPVKGDSNFTLVSLGFNCLDPVNALKLIKVVRTHLPKNTALLFPLNKQEVICINQDGEFGVSCSKRMATFMNLDKKEIYS